MQNRLSDLNNHLFAQLERLSDEDLSPEQIEMESGRAKSIVDVSKEIIGNATLQFKAASLVAEHGNKISGIMPESFGQMKTIEHQKPKTALTLEEAEQAVIDARRRERGAEEERKEAARQRKENANGEA